MGRPSKFETVNLDVVKMLATKGFTDKEMSMFLGVSEQTFNNWKKKHPEFFESLKGWKTEADSKVEKSLYERATGYSCPEYRVFNNDGEAMVVPTVKYYPPDTTAAIFWLKNRKPQQWRDKQEVDSTVNASVKQEMPESVEEKLDAILKSQRRS